MGARTEVRMRELDAFSWTGEQDALLRRTIVAVAVLPGTTDWARVTEGMDRLARDVPMFRQRVVEALSFPVNCSGAPVEGLSSNSPTAGSAVNTTVISYRGVYNVGVNIDTAAVDDPEVLLDCLRHGFEEVLALSGAHAPVRPPLREAREAPTA